MENRKWLVLDRSDFGRPNLSLSFSTDLMTSEAEADDCATSLVRDGFNDVYMFRLERIYRPMPDEESRQVEICYIEPEDEAFNPSRDDPYGKLQYGWCDGLGAAGGGRIDSGNQGAGGGARSIYPEIFNFGGTE